MTRTLLFILSGLALFAARFDLHTPGKIVRVADPQISPDGKAILVLVSKANFDENRWDSVLTLLDPATKASRQLTRDRRGIPPAGPSRATTSHFSRHPPRAQNPRFL
jgi:dipeptidyl aminopeptidase/acylaminoacyl peptidase